MVKVVINTRYGGFGLSKKAEAMLGTHPLDVERDNPDLVNIVETLGEDADGGYSHLKVIEIPDGVEWVIQEYDGLEWVAEKHRVWG